MFNVIQEIIAFYLRNCAFSSSGKYIIFARPQRLRIAGEMRTVMKYKSMKSKYLPSWLIPEPGGATVRFVGGPVSMDISIKGDGCSMSIT